MRTVSPPVSDARCVRASFEAWIDENELLLVAALMVVAHVMIQRLVVLKSIHW
jgi:hypothetical protein